MAGCYCSTTKIRNIKKELPQNFAPFKKPLHGSKSKLVGNLVLEKRCVTFILFNYLLNIRCQALCNVDVIFFFIQIRVFLTAGVSATDGLQCRDAAVGSFIRNYSSEELQVDNPLEQRIQMPFGNRLSRFFGWSLDFFFRV